MLFTLISAACAIPALDCNPIGIGQQQIVVGTGGVPCMTQLPSLAGNMDVPVQDPALQAQIAQLIRTGDQQMACQQLQNVNKLDCFSIQPLQTQDTQKIQCSQVCPQGQSTEKESQSIQDLKEYFKEKSYEKQSKESSKSKQDTMGCDPEKMEQLLDQEPLKLEKRQFDYDPEEFYYRPWRPTWRRSYRRCMRLARLQPTPYLQRAYMRYCESLRW